MPLAAVVAQTLFTHKTDLSLSVAADRATWYPREEPLDNVPPGACETAAFGDKLSEHQLKISPHHAVLTFTSSCKSEGYPDRTVFVLGDSHVWVYGRLFRSAASRLPVDFRTYRLTSCPYPESAIRNTVYPSECIPFHQVAVQDILSKSKPGDILFLPGARINEMPHAWRIDTVDGAPPTTLGTAHDMGLAKWREALTPFIEKGLLVLLEQPKPVFGYQAFRCSDWFNASNSHCRLGGRVEKKTILGYSRLIITTMEALAEQQTKIFLWNPMPTLCPGRVCTVYPQGPTQAGEFTPWFFDENHLGTAMLEELFEPFIDQLELVLATQ